MLQSGNNNQDSQGVVFIFIYLFIFIGFPRYGDLDIWISTNIQVFFFF